MSISRCLTRCLGQDEPWGVDHEDRLRSCREHSVTSADERPAVFAGRIFVRSRRPRNSWVSWNYNYRRGPQLVVRATSFEVSAPQGMLLESRRFVIQSHDAVMRRDWIGWAGTPVNRKRCIHVAARDQKGRRIELALTPDDGLENAWKALLDSGVSRAAGNDNGHDP